MKILKKSRLTMFLLAIAITLSACSPPIYKIPTLEDTENNEMDNNIETNPEISETEDVSNLHPMSIKSLRQNNYSGEALKIEESLSDGYNYKRYIASYLSEDLKIYGLLTIPKSQMPEGGFPAILFIHGYIPPKEYSTINSYPTYQDTLARNHIITFKPDLRGHGNSEGKPVSAHFSEKYIIDALYAINSLKKQSQVNPKKIGYWGHSNGGEIGLRAILVSNDIKAASLWAGVVGSYQDMFETYNHKIPFLQNITENNLIKENGLPSTNPDFWKQLDPYNFISEIKIPIQLQHGTNDDSVPIELSLSLKKALEENDKFVEYIEYQNDNHNISNNAAQAWQKTIEFFKNNL